MSNTNDLFCNTTPIDRRKARKAITELYSFCNARSYESDFWQGYTTGRPCKEPEIIFASGPKEVAERFNPDDTELVDLGRFNNIAHFVSKRGYGSKERVHSAVVQIFNTILPYKKAPRSWASPLFMPIDYLYSQERSSDWEKLASNAWDEMYLAFTYEDRCYVIDRPRLVETNERGLHCKDGPAMAFRDGSEIYCYEGIKVSETSIRHPEQMTLKDIHQHNSRKHILIDLCGVDRYLELCKEWKPDVKGKFNKFFSMAEMKPKPGSWDVKTHGKDWDGYGKMYKDSPAFVKFSNHNVNDRYALCLEDNYNELYAFWTDKHPFDAEYAHKIFNEEDRELWDLFDIREMQSRGILNFNVSFQNDVFRLQADQMYDGFPPCRHDVAPSWFKAKMFRGEDALYENEELNYAVAYKDGKIMYSGDIEPGRNCIAKDEPSKPIKARNSLFSGCENLPIYQFNLDLQADTWEGLLEKWATLAFNWLGMHEDSSRMP